MKSISAKLAGAALVIAAVVAFLLSQGRDGSGGDQGRSTPAEKKAQRAAKGGNETSPALVERSSGSREERFEDAKLHESKVAVELEPDMEYFKGTGEGLGDATLEDMKAGRLSGSGLAAALAALRGTDFDELPVDVTSFLTSEDEDVRRAALAVLAGSGPLVSAKAWEAVRDGSDPVAMLAVMKITASKGGAETGVILSEAIEAAHPQIRYEAMEMVEPLQGKDERARREVLQAATSSRHADTALSAIGQLSSDPRKADLAILFGFLDHPDQQVSASARGGIDFLINEEFSTSAQARTWWEVHAGNFDDELSPAE